jgi:hypothetical protein
VFDRGLQRTSDYFATREGGDRQDAMPCTTDSAAAPCQVVAERCKGELFGWAHASVVIWDGGIVTTINNKGLLTNINRRWLLEQSDSRFDMRLSPFDDGWSRCWTCSWSTRTAIPVCLESAHIVKNRPDGSSRVSSPMAITSLH